ncbi:hypothetical protein [Pontibacter harenae]|uniref:hypothetical protein n=1 Tax=Pontibacter harenae TaxID=2894083 RepID=UPI001E37DA3E|nr:hypothetical protein [Pontibacter harenae]MCC9167351.1 hypothetical protein [Pontibacter harenae]
MIGNHSYLSWLVAAAVILLLVWLAWRRPNRQRLVWRVVASIVAGISIVLLLFPPTFQKAIDPTSAILLTEGFDTDTLEALLQQQEAKPHTYTYRTSAAEAKPLTDLYSLQQEQPSLQILHILGYGLEDEDLRTLQHVQVVPHLSPAPAGVAALQWPESVKLGETVQVAGKYKSTENEWLYLQAAGQVQDSVGLKSDSTLTFQLRYTPKQEGRFTYRILAKKAGAVDTLGQVPVQVQSVKKLEVLLLTSSPSFEFKFLKNYLAEQQHRVAWRSTISKDISQSEWANMPKVSLERVTQKLLQNFDVVITEPEALQSMSATERATLQRAATEEGLGILTIASAPVNSRSTSFFTNFQTKRISQQDTRTTHASWSGTTEASTFATPYTLVSSSAITGLVEEKGNNLLAGAKQTGWGKVAMSLVPQTFPWQLEGKEQVYASYWATLLTAIAKQEVKEKFWKLTSPQIPQPNKPAVLSFTDYTLDAAAPPVATVTSLTDSVSISLPLAQHPLQGEQFSGTFWPHQTGWHVAQTPDAPPYYFFVQDTASWAFESIQQRQQATQAYVARQSIKSAEATIAYQEEQVPLIWFFLLFVLSSGFLWLEEKL